MAKLGQRASCPLGVHPATGGAPVVPVVCDMSSPTLRQRPFHPQITRIVRQDELHRSIQTFKHYDSRTVTPMWTVPTKAAMPGAGSLILVRNDSRHGLDARARNQNTGNAETGCGRTRKTIGKIRFAHPSASRPKYMQNGRIASIESEGGFFKLLSVSRKAGFSEFRV